MTRHRKTDGTAFRVGELHVETFDPVGAGLALPQGAASSAPT